MRALLLGWADAEHADVSELHRFECTEPSASLFMSALRRVYRRPHEARAQRIIHHLNPGKAARSDQRIWLGRDTEGIAAVISWQWVNKIDLQIVVAALHKRLRYQGTGYTDEMVETAEVQISGEALARGLREITVSAKIHEKNRASHHFADRFRLAPLSDPDSDGYILYGGWRSFVGPE